MKKRLQYLVLMLLVTPFFVGCVAKKKLDAAAQALIIAVQENDFATYQKIADHRLVQKFPKEKFHETHLAFKVLGPFQSRSMRGIKANLGGSQKGTYHLIYKKGTARLELSLFNDKIVQFGFYGKDILAAVEKFRSKKYNSYAITNFDFIDVKGASITSNMSPPGKVSFRFRVQGLVYRQKQADFSVSVKVQRDAGPIQNLPLLNHKSLPFQRDGSGWPSAHVNGHLNFPTAGTYKLTFVVVDHHSNKTLRYLRAFVIQPSH